MLQDEHCVNEFLLLHTEKNDVNHNKIREKWIQYNIAALDYTISDNVRTKND